MEFKVIGQARDGKECLDLLEECTPDILLLDINMPNINGLGVLEKLKAIKSKVKVLILTIHNEVEYLLKAVDIGCNGYVLKDSDSSLLKKAIISVYEGDSFIQPDLIPILNAGLVNIS